MNRETKKDVFFITILLVLFLIIRTIFLFYSPETYDIDECYQTSLTKDILRGDPKDFSPPYFMNFQLPHYMGGATIFNIVAIPFSLLFGFSDIVFKTVALSFSLTILVFFYFFIKRFFNRKIAVITTLLMVFAPPTYIIKSLIFMAESPHTFLFIIISMFFFFKIFFSKDKTEYNNKNFFLLGLTITVAVWFSYTSLVALLLYLIFWFIDDKKFFIKKTFLFFILGFFIGFLPWFYYNANTSFSGIGQLTEERKLLEEKNLINPIYNNAPTNIWYRPLSTLLYDLPNSFQFKNLFFIKGIFFNYIYYFLFLIAFSYILIWYRGDILNAFKIRKLENYKIKRIIFVLSYILLFLLIYIVSGYSVEPIARGTSDCCTRMYWYLLPVFPFLFVVISIFIYSLYTNHRGKVFLYYFLILILVILLGNLGSLSKTNRFSMLNSECRVFSISDIPGIAKTGQGPITNLSQLTATCNSMEEEERSLCYRAAGREFYYLFGREGAIRKCKQIPDEYAYFCYQDIIH